MDEQADEIHRLRKKFQCLKETFAWCLTTEVWKTTLRIGMAFDMRISVSLLSILYMYQMQGKEKFDYSAIGSYSATGQEISKEMTKSIVGISSV